MSCVMKEFPFSSRKLNKFFFSFFQEKDEKRKKNKREKLTPSPRESVDKFNREIETIENLSHPNIVQYLHHVLSFPLSLPICLSLNLFFLPNLTISSFVHLGKKKKKNRK